MSLRNRENGPSVARIRKRPFIVENSQNKCQFETCFLSPLCGNLKQSLTKILPLPHEHSFDHLVERFSRFTFWLLHRKLLTAVAE
jgi:hypothetical protein